MGTELFQSCDQFLPGIKVQNIIPYGSGHINDTFKVETENKNYLLQRVNHSIFKNVEGLTGNIIKVTQHLRNKIKNKKTQMKVLTLVGTTDGDFIIKDIAGNYWRMFRFIENSKSYDRVEGTDLAFEGGKAYGRFMLMLDDFPVRELVETIPQFHNIQFRLSNFYKSVKKDHAGRVGGAKKEIDFVNQRADEMKMIHQLGIENRIPLRVTHNDTKINNVLFNDQDKGICVIDLDTVMPGYVHFDFGDAIRTFTNSADEDEKELSKVSMNIEYFKAFSTGFLSEMKDVLSETEKENLAFSAKLMTFIIGLRFLTDYLEGDTYYKTNYPEHNLVRARVQFKLLESMEDQYEEMENVIGKLT
jgi:Ser/Thr protein kinase RdoA (MazF antagonist)